MAAFMVLRLTTIMVKSNINTPTAGKKPNANVNMVGVLLQPVIH
jgi:hypothetical protein